MTAIRPIIHTITRLEAGGAPRSLLLLLQGLERRGIRVELATGIAPPPAEDLLPEAESLGISVHIITSLRRDPNPVLDLIALFSLWRLFLRRRPRLVHAHTSKAGFISRLAALLAGVKTRVYSPRGTILEGYFTGFRKWFFTLLDRLAARWTDIIIGLTAEESESYLEAGIGKPEQHIQIPIGIDWAAYAPPDMESRLTSRRHHDIQDHEVLIVSTGRLVPVKDHATLIRSLGLLRKETAGWKCWIVGSGPEEGRLRELTAELGLDEQVQFLGYREDVSKLLGLGDIFVLSSTNEGFGRALLEAMSARLAVVATTVGGIPTVLDNGAAGHMVPPGNPEALAEVLRPLVLSPEKRDKWASLALERVKTAFGLERMIEEHVKLYAALLNDL